MKYVNSDTDVEIELTGLTEEKTKFYRQALEKFRKNVDWLVFEEFVFGPMSPLYSGRKSRREVVEDPLYLALEDMWLQLGIQQGMVKAETTQEDHADGERGQENRGRKADDRPNSARDRHLATTR
jgi:hypothetical protein